MRVEISVDTDGPWDWPLYSASVRPEGGEAELHRTAEFLTYREARDAALEWARSQDLEVVDN